MAELEWYDFFKKKQTNLKISSKNSIRQPSLKHEISRRLTKIVRSFYVGTVKVKLIQSFDDALRKTIFLIFSKT